MCCSLSFCWLFCFAFCETKPHIPADSLHQTKQIKPHKHTQTTPLTDKSPSSFLSPFTMHSNMHLNTQRHEDTQDSSHQVPAARLRKLLATGKLNRMPCCFDAFSARLVEQAGFAVTQMSGFSVSASRLAVPDTGLISYGEMLDQGRNICSAVNIPVIGDADTGFGNTISAQRTVVGYAQAGFAGIMVEDQIAPKRCGHVKGKAVLNRDEAMQRMRAVCEARDSLWKKGLDLVIVARTDSCTTHGIDEAIIRANMFYEMGAEICFIEAPGSLEEMKRICKEVKGYKMANLIESGSTPILPPSQLESLGFNIAMYSVTLVSAAAKSMMDALNALQTDIHPYDNLIPFKQLKEIVGFPSYDTDLERLEGETPETLEKKNSFLFSKKVPLKKHLSGPDLPPTAPTKSN